MEKGLEFTVDYSYPIPAFIQTDPTRLKQVLLNLCSNAIKFTEKGFVRINVSYSVMEQSIDVIVSDSGIGIKASQLEHLFQPFEQADSTTTRKFGGTGLGLYISRELVRKMGGDIYVESLSGVGTKITFNVKSGSVNQDELVSNETEISIFKEKQLFLSNVPKLKGKILLAEDSEDNQALFKLFITATGANVEIASDGIEAVELAQQGRYDLILMDMQMPRMDGLQATRHIISQGNNTPIVAITANAMKEDRENCQKAGCVGFLSKPIDKDEFYKVLSEYLEPSVKKSIPEKSIPEKSIPRKSIKEPLNLKQPSYRQIEAVDFHGDSEMKALMIKFINSLDKQITLLADALKRSDWDEFKMIIHKLKGTAGSFGFPNISRQSEKLEELIKNTDFDAIPLELDALCNMCDYIKDYK